jgi:hypothetical protein
MVLRPNLLFPTCLAVPKCPHMPGVMARLGAFAGFALALDYGVAE